MRLRNKKIIRQLFIHSKTESYSATRDGYLADDYIYNREFRIQKYFLVDTLTAKLPNRGSKLMAIFLKPWMFVLLVLLTFIIYSISKLPIHTWAMEYYVFAISMRFIIPFWTIFIIIFNGVHPIVFKKYFQLRLSFYAEKRNEKFKSEDEAVEKMIGDNIQLQRKLKLDKIK